MVGQDNINKGCKQCRRDRSRERFANDPEFRERELARTSEIKRERRANDPEFREREREHGRERMREKRANDPEFRERQLDSTREWYHSLSGMEYNRLLLRQRRNGALQRRKKRDQQMNKED